MLFYNPLKRLTALPSAFVLLFPLHPHPHPHLHVIQNLGSFHPSDLSLNITSSVALYLNSSPPEFCDSV